MNIRQAFDLIYKALGVSAVLNNKKLSELTDIAVVAIKRDKDEASALLTQLREEQERSCSRSSTIAKLTLQRNLHEQDALAQRQKAEKQGRIRASIQLALEKERDRYRSDLAYYKAEKGYSNANNTLKYHLGQIEKELSPMARLALAQILAMSDEWLHSPDEDDS